MRPLPLPELARTRKPGITAAVAGLMLLALVLGGGTRQGLGPDFALQLLALPLLGVALARVLAMPWRHEWRWPLALLGLVALLPLVQLLPMPPALWTRLPGRAGVADGFAVAGMALPWMPLSLSPEATARSAAFLLPPAAVFLAVLQVDEKGRRVLSLGLVLFALLAVTLGLAQLMGGAQSPLYFHEITNRSSSVGFFANRNHHAALLYALMPVAAAWAIGMLYDQRPGRVLAVVLCITVGVLLMLGLGMAGSRAGLLMAMLAGLGVLAMAWRSGDARRTRAAQLVLAAGLVGVVLVVQFGLIGILQRLERDPMDDYRFQIAEVAAVAARAHAPVGAGLGSFVPVYAAHEPAEVMLGAYVNHAHNDWLELWVEAGVPGLALAAAFTAWWLWAGMRVWRNRAGRAGRASRRFSSALDAGIARGAWLSIGLLMLHSTLDYPLRTTALACLLALLAGLLLRPEPVGEAR